MLFLRHLGCRLRLLVLCLTFIVPGFAQADAWRVLNEPGVVGLMRHALAPGTGDPADFQIDDCGTQRNLDARGRSQAEAIGEALRAEGVRIDRVLSSAWCRCQETAVLLGLAPVETAPALNSFFQNRDTASDQTSAAVELIDALDGQAILVTHQVNITALTGVFPRSGEIVAVRMTDGALTVVDRLLIDP